MCQTGSAYAPPSPGLPAGDAAPVPTHPCQVTLPSGTGCEGCPAPVLMGNGQTLMHGLTSTVFLREPEENHHQEPALAALSSRSSLWFCLFCFLHESACSLSPSHIFPVPFFLPSDFRIVPRDGNEGGDFLFPFVLFFLCCSTC